MSEEIGGDLDKFTIMSSAYNPNLCSMSPIVMPVISELE